MCIDIQVALRQRVQQFCGLWLILQRGLVILFDISMNLACNEYLGVR